nr:tetratricopeptide repeat protein [Bacteroides sp.]
MANEKNNEEARNAVDNINDSLTSIEQKVQNNQKIIMWGCVGAAVVVVLILFYVYAFRMPRIQAANDAIGQADTELMAGNDSIALLKYKTVADEFGGDASNRAALNAAILLYQNKKYEEALDYLKKYDTKESVIGAGALSLEGDCYVNLKKYDEALGCFKKAVKESDNNPAYTPFFMMKEATVLHELKRYAEEADIYAEIIKEYPAYGDNNRLDLEKYLERAKALAGQK